MPSPRISFLRSAMAGALCLVAHAGCGHQTVRDSKSTESASASFDFAGFTGSQHFELNTLPTTSYGPAWADIVVKPENFLECRGVAIALCYYSGPTGVTPCVSDGKGIANCTCYEMPADVPYFVDINAILNRDVYLETVAACGKDGANCLPRGSLSAPVCTAINNKTLIPGADLVSTFSPFLEKKMPISPTLCATPAPYAGCMTAPCKRTGTTDPTTGLPLVECSCPTFTGPYQVGTAINTDQCVLGGTSVWSAAYTPPQQPPK